MEDYKDTQIDAELNSNMLLVQNASENKEDISEIEELQRLNVWGQSQEVLEKQALHELEIFTVVNQTSKVTSQLEEGEVSDDSKEDELFAQSPVRSNLDITSYIKQQEEFKKRQQHKRALQISEHSKDVAERVSRNHNQNLASKIFKRKAEDNKKTKVKRKRQNSNCSVQSDSSGKQCVEENNAEDASGSEYVPSDESNHSDSDYGGKLESTKQSKGLNKRGIERVRDDGCLELYKTRLEQYYKNMEREQADGLIEEGDVEIQGGLKVPAKMWNNLFSYQQKGIKWLWRLHQQKSGGLLGDEMGLGKTVQVIVFLAALERTRVVSRHQGLGATLIVSPATVLHQWVKHFQDWAPEFRVAVLHQSGSYAGNKTQLARDINKCKGVLITTYSGILKYKGILAELNWHYLILDEGHKIRNPLAKVSIAIKQLRTPHRIMLTGSPMQNNLQELWSLFDFIVPGMLGTLSTFVEHFANPIMHGGYANATPMQEATALSVASALKDIISPHLLRRSKNEVRKHICLPNKSEQVLFCSLTNEQRDLYKGYLMSEHVSMILGRGGKNWFSQNHVRANVLVAITTLRKICNHPDLYLGEAETNYFNTGEDTPIEDRFGYYKRSGKMVVVSALLKIWKRQQHRVLLFTQARAMMGVFEEFLEQQGYKYLKMDGSTSIGARQPLIDKFNQDSSYDVFLLTTRVGGLGVNLTGANRVIIYDPDWNPATDTQARERAWRIGQEKEVTVYRLISGGTIEEKMYQRQVWKQLLSNKVLLDPKTQRFFKTSDLHDLFSLQEQADGSNPETANIFRNSRVQLQEKIDSKKTGKLTETPTTSSKESFQFSDEKIQAMKNLAQQISKNMSTSSANGTTEVEEKSGYQKQLEEERAQKLKEKAYLKTLTPLELRILNRKKLENKEDDHINKVDDYDTSISFSKALTVAEKTAQFYHELKDNKCKSSSSGANSIDSSEMTSNYKGDCGGSSSKLEDYTKLDCKERHKEKRKSKKKHKGAVKVDRSGTVDGEVVEGLLKREVKKNEKGSKSSDTKGENQDDYVLEKLFSRKGVQSALQHEVIVQSGYKDENKLKVKWEAQQRTDLALKALRKSRLDNWRW